MFHSGRVNGNSPGIWKPLDSDHQQRLQAPKRFKHDIFVLEAMSGEIVQITSGRGSNENPHWSPDGRHIAFQSDRSGSKQLFIMNLNGQGLKQLTAYGINESPGWSSYVRDVR